GPTPCSGTGSKRPDCRPGHSPAYPLATGTTVAGESRMRKLGLWVLFAGIAMVAPARAAVFVVDTTFDAPDLNPGDGVCMSFLGCTVRAAVMEASALPIAVASHDVILPLDQTY